MYASLMIMQDGKERPLKTLPIAEIQSLAEMLKYLGYQVRVQKL